MKVIDVTPVLVEKVSTKEYLRLMKTSERNIKRSTFIPPKLGDKHFGRFEIEYKYPVFKALQNAF